MWPATIHSPSKGKTDVENWHIETFSLFKSNYLLGNKFFHSLHIVLSE